MPLPFSYSGRISVRGPHDHKAALHKIERGLERLGARRVVRLGLEIQFSAGVVHLVLPKNFLAVVGSGGVQARLSQAGLAVTYRIRFTQILVASILAVGFFSPWVLVAPNLSGREATAFLVGMWLWLYGGSVVVAIINFRRWLRNTVES